ncbi:MAG TPA: ATP-binding protein [Methanomicrobiales archaeon]|nr:ATP-binding protein [Methanomicrobiales archaeon]
MAPPSVLTIPADVKRIPQVTAALGEALKASGFSDEAILDLQLAVEEAFANTIVHGYRGKAGEVTIAIHATEEAVEVTIEDNAPPFNPLSIPEPDRGSDLGDRRIGGLGIYLIRQVVDAVDHSYVDGKNILRLVKKRLHRCGSNPC